MPERRSPLYDYHLRHAAQLVRGGGDYLVPLCYTAPTEEHLAVRRDLGMQDLSSMGEIDLKGPGAERLLDQLLVNHVRDLEPGQLRYSTMCNPAGGIVDDVTVYKFHDEHFMLVTSSAPRRQSARWIAEHAVGTATYVTDISASIALPVIQGPRSREFLASVLGEIELERLRYFRFAPARLGDVSLVVSRSGYTGELGYELYTPAEDAGWVWDHLLASGRSWGLRPYGAAAMHSLRLEKGYVLYGVDISDEQTPYHAGLDRWIRFEKRSFIGREALLRVQQQGVAERLVGLTLERATPVPAGAAILPISDVATRTRRHLSGAEAGATRDELSAGSTPIGRITTCASAPTVGGVLALGYLDVHHAWPGARVAVHDGHHVIAAVVTPTPFFDPAGARLRARPGRAS
jgi:aminomethyltransferase